MVKSTLLLDNFLLKANVLIHQVLTNYIIAVSSFHSQLATSAVDSPRPPLSPSPASRRRLSPLRLSRLAHLPALLPPALGANTLDSDCDCVISG